jgi:hypothetical protein
MWTTTQLRKFLDVTKEEPFYALYLIAATTGLRRFELLDLWVMSTECAVSGGAW